MIFQKNWPFWLFFAHFSVFFDIFYLIEPDKDSSANGASKAKYLGETPCRSVGRSVRRSVRRSVGPSVPLYFFSVFELFEGRIARVLVSCGCLCPCPNHFCPCPTHYCPCPTARDRGSRVYGLVCSSLKGAMSVHPYIPSLKCPKRHHGYPKRHFGNLNDSLGTQSGILVTQSGIWGSTCDIFGTLSGIWAALSGI